MQTGTGEAEVAGLSYGRQRLYGAHAARSRLGRAGHWLVQVVAQAAQGCSKGDSGKDWGGEEMV